MILMFAGPVEWIGARDPRIAELELSGRVPELCAGWGETFFSIEGRQTHQQLSSFASLLSLVIPQDLSQSAEHNRVDNAGNVVVRFDVDVEPDKIFGEQPLEYASLLPHGTTRRGLLVGMTTSHIVGCAVERHWLPPLTYGEGSFGRICLRVGRPVPTLESRLRAMLGAQPPTGILRANEAK